ncbi:SagB family peptide dehydrogenase [Gloeothece verrucosa]|uniref:SagB-type dehydrogenase domain protein n=1 Tax=Gloeothece verrucosa (strain PCC 7822) TaxID=497965 RepID=E0UMX2_GLOV7|nr:SagB family peptide dehydrogenase [Gloeothece verrucosa]ADN18302.1 SagB-type dehydrogenase domain protein [Gloeothece verrucosa PCC 7822]
MNSFFTLSLGKDINLIAEDEKIILQSNALKLSFSASQLRIKTAFNHLKNYPKTFSELQELVKEKNGQEAVEKFTSYIEKLTYLGWICHSVFPLATAIPMTGDYQFSCPEIDWQQQTFTLSRFAYLHQIEGQMLLESPRSKAKIILLDWRATALIGKLSQPQSCASLAEEIPDLTEELTQQFISLLLATKMLSLEAENTHLIKWEFHDLLFHSRSRKGRHSNPVGGTYRFLEKMEPLPVVKPPMSEQVIQLYKPNLEELAKTDISLTQVLESRRSIREYNENPITVEQLGELLYRCARIKEVIDLKEKVQVSRRPYPGGGAIYELEIYPAINYCQGLEAALYHYRPDAHELELVTQWNQGIETLFTDAYNASAQHGMPQILLIITARFGRFFWKYQSMAYAAILKHVGVMYQTLYLVTTAMKLAPCALGSGNSDIFAKATGIDYYEESSVGEFMLGAIL